MVLSLAKFLRQTLFLWAFYICLVSLPFLEAYQDIRDYDTQKDKQRRFILLTNQVPCQCIVPV